MRPAEMPIRTSLPRNVPHSGVCQVPVPGRADSQRVAAGPGGLEAAIGSQPGKAMIAELEQDARGHVVSLGGQRVGLGLPVSRQDGAGGTRVSSPGRPLITSAYRHAW